MSEVLRVGLQEWAVCARALAAGRTILIVRKGGIHEPRGGLFQVEHPRFALLPTTLHQAADRLRPAYAGAFLAATATPPPVGQIPVAAWAAVAGIWRITTLEGLRTLGDDLPWSDAELEARLAYRGQRWLFVLALRVQVLTTPVLLPDRPSYAGCRSWIPLEDGVPTGPATPAVADDAWQQRLARVSAALGPVRA